MGNCKEFTKEISFNRNEIYRGGGKEGVRERERESVEIIRNLFN